MPLELFKIKTSKQTTVIRSNSIIAIAARMTCNGDPYVVIDIAGGDPIWMEAASWDEAIGVVENLEL